MDFNEENKISENYMENGIEVEVIGAIRPLYANRVRSASQMTNGLYENKRSVKDSIKGNKILDQDGKTIKDLKIKAKKLLMQKKAVSYARSAMRNGEGTENQRSTMENALRFLDTNNYMTWTTINLLLGICKNIGKRRGYI